jgi:heterotetrameric sarcosine oxidase gamma subunit
MTTFAHKRTPLYSWHRQHGARFAEHDGWLIPVDIDTGDSGPAGVELADVSFLGKVELLGAVTALAHTLADNGSLERPRSVIHLTEQEGLVCRLADDRLLVLAETLQAGWSDAVNRLAAEHGVIAWDATSAHAAFHLRGPQIEGLLRRVTSLDVRTNGFPGGSCAETALAGVQALLVRPPDSGDFRLHVGWDVAKYVWERLLEVGDDAGLKVVSWDRQGGHNSPDRGAMA